MKGRTLAKVHLVRAIIYVCLWVAATTFGWVAITAFVSHVSMLALVEAAIMGWTAAKAEKAAEE